VRAITAGRLVLPAQGQGQISPVYVDDLVEGIVLAASTPAAAGHVFTLTGGETVTTSAFFGHYARMLGKTSIPVAPTTVVIALAATIGRLLGDGDVSPDAVRYIARRGGYSIEKARTVLGYRPSVDLVEGMRGTEAWLRENGLLTRAAEKVSNTPPA
jgi:nucleoside-diphosphate-sugar epimerase